MALCCDVTFIADNARIGYPPTRVWGCPTTAMWVYRVGMEKAKRILFEGRVLSGPEAAEVGLIGECVPEAELDARVDEYIASIIEVPLNQLFFQKQVVNQAMEQMGLLNTQRLATVTHSPIKPTSAASGPLRTRPSNRMRFAFSMPTRYTHIAVVGHPHTRVGG